MSAAKEVTWEDQQRICAFSRMNARAHEINSEIKHKEKQIDDLDEASTELAVNDEDDACVLMGECFVKMDNEQAEAKVEAMLTREAPLFELLPAVSPHLPLPPPRLPPRPATLCGGSTRFCAYHAQIWRIHVLGRAAGRLGGRGPWQQVPQRPLWRRRARAHYRRLRYDKREGRGDHRLPRGRHRRHDAGHSAPL